MPDINGRYVPEDHEAAGLDDDYAEDAAPEPEDSEEE